MAKTKMKSKPVRSVFGILKSDKDQKVHKSKQNHSFGEIKNDVKSLSNTIEFSDEEIPSESSFAQKLQYLKTRCINKVDNDIISVPAELPGDTSHDMDTSNNLKDVLIDSDKDDYLLNNNGVGKPIPKKIHIYDGADYNISSEIKDTEESENNDHYSDPHLYEINPIHVSDKSELTLRSTSTDYESKTIESHSSIQSDMHKATVSDVIPGNYSIEFLSRSSVKDSFDTSKIQSNLFFILVIESVILIE